MGDATLGPTAVNFGTVGDLVNVINRSCFGTDRFIGFRSVKVSNFLYLSGTAHNTV